MRSWIFAVITLAFVTIGDPVAACPVGGQEGLRPRPIQNVSLQTQASEMVQRASRLESAAGAREQSARSLEQEADVFSARARLLRNQAQLVNASDRFGILDMADELSERAANDRAEAASERAQAASLRMEATNLRQRARELVRLGGGGGWKRRLDRPTSTPVPSERSVVL